MESDATSSGSEAGTQLTDASAATPASGAGHRPTGAGEPAGRPSTARRLAAHRT